MTRRTLLAVFVACCCFSGTVPAQQTSPGNHVILLGTIKVKPGRDEDFKKVLTEMSARMHREDTGNVRFEFYSVAPGRGQDPGAPSTFYEYEEWIDQASSSAHARWAGPILQTTWKEMTESYSFARLTPLDLK